MKRDHLTRDAFLGGRLHLWQPQNGFRAGIDSVLLAAAVTALEGQSVLDLGCGVGAVSFCLATRVRSLSLTGIERQSAYAELARRNARDLNFSMDVIGADIANLPQNLQCQKFDHVIANPPYFDPRTRKASKNTEREAALSGQTPLDVWIEVAMQQLVPKGHFFVIYPAARLSELLNALKGRLGTLAVLPIAARSNQAARLVLVRARKDTDRGLRLLSPLILHTGTRHMKDAESYRPEVNCILREGSELTWH
ncbi:MAG: methyltransferase [Aestuariivita sp.]|nr:methyltransferase [Aestuariivita sp.]MCY4202229.1 methyltransferase [Aestuariivita sp.]